MKKKIFALATLLVGLLIFIYAIKIIGVDEIVHQFQTIDPFHILLYLLVSMILVTVLMLKWQYILRTLGYKVKFFNLFMYRQMGYSIGYVVPSFYIGGQTIKALFLKKHDIPTTDAIASVLIDRAVELPLNFLVACFMFILIIYTLSLPTYMVIILASILVILISLAVFFFYRVFNKKYCFAKLTKKTFLKNLKFISQVQDKIEETESNLIRFFNGNKKHFITSLLFSCVLWFLMMLEFKTALSIVGFNATLAQIYLVVTMTGFAMMFPVPASIGVMELSQIAIAVMVGIPPAVAVALSILVRTRDFMWILLGIIGYFKHGTSYVKTLIQDFKNGNKKST